MEQTQILRSRAAVSDFVRQCVDIPKFRRCCQQCAGFGGTWSCPPFTFSPEGVWRRYRVLWLYGEKVFVPEALRARQFTPEALGSESTALLRPVKERILGCLLSMETQHPGSMALSAGSCRLCGEGNCTRPQGLPCRQPERMRYSIEALGGDVGRAASLYLGEEMVWGQEGHLPPYYLLIGGLLAEPAEETAGI